MSLRLCFPSDPCELGAVRNRVREYLARCGYGECEVELIVLAIDEACTNIIRHAYENQRHTVRMELSQKEGLLRVTLRDYGKPCNPSKIQPRDLADIRPGGIGVYIIRKVFDKTEYIPCSRGTRLILEKKLPS